MGVNSKVLVVDDQEGIRKLLRELCSLLGYDVITAPSGTEALKLAVGHKIKAALVDVKMPGLNGIQILRELYDRYPGVTLGLMTGYDDINLWEDFFEQYQCEIIRKPFDLDTVKEFLEKAFRGTSPVMYNSGDGKRV